jgi:hypothetical protein
MPCMRIWPERSTDTSCQGCCARLAMSEGSGRAVRLVLAVIHIGQVTAVPEGCGRPTSICLPRRCEMWPDVLCNVMSGGVYCVMGIAG